jgi:hypothetical protein
VNKKFKVKFGNELLDDEAVYFIGGKEMVGCCPQIV